MEENQETTQEISLTLEEILNKLSCTRSHEYKANILPLEDTIADRVVQKLKINSYQRKLRSFELGRINKTVVHKNVEINLELNAVNDSLGIVGIDLSKCDYRKDGRLHFIREIKRKYREIQKDVLSHQSFLLEWEEMQKSQRNQIKSLRKEIEQLYKQCLELINLNRVIKRLKDMAIKFYDQYYSYYKYILDVINNYRQEVSYDEFKGFIDSCYLQNSEVDFSKSVEDFDDAKESFRKLKAVTLNSYETELQECLDLFIQFMEEENTSDDYKIKLNDLKQLIQKETLEQEAALIGLEQLNNFCKEYFPKELYETIDQDTFEGKFKVVKEAYKTMCAICKLAEKDNIRKIEIK